MNANTPVAPVSASPLADVFDRARRQEVSLGDVMKLAESLLAAGLKAQVCELYKTWIAFNDKNPLVHLAAFNYSVVLRELGDVAGCIQVLRGCLAKDPKFGPAHINLGRALEDSGLLDQAVLQWKEYSELVGEVTPDALSHRLMALQHSGRVLEGAARLEGAETMLWQAIELQPMKPEAAQHWISIRQHLCKWPVLTPSHHVSMRQLLDSISPLPLGCYSDDPFFQLAKGYRYYKSLVGRPDVSQLTPSVPKKKTGTGQKLRIGYVSSDLRQHAVGFALSEVFELHDKQNVEVYAYYCGEARQGDAVQERFKASVDCWRDITALDDLGAARQIQADEIDVLIDVNGYTKSARTRIFSYRPAPVIINFCGYPGSMATPFHQYIISDNYIIPPENELYYTEKVLRIPCDQPIDRKRPVAVTPTREEAGLPEDAFVYVCFNGMQKITEACFTRWLAILSATSGSVLWLLSGDESANERLRQRAMAAGVDASRLIFAPKVPNHVHLARIALGDLFLDTFPYGAHSTAADAIGVGLPVLTVPGKSFPSRFCASIVSAAGIPEMICETADQYVAQAIAFANDRAGLAAVRESLAKQRETCDLRDMPALARRLEELYWQVQGEAERGETPVPDLRNLDVYYEIGAELIQMGPEFETEEAYRARYREKLAEWNAFEPIGFDARLWPEVKA